MTFFESLRYFKAEEFDSPEKMDTEFLSKLDFARARAGVPFNLSSSYRGGDLGAHGEGLAVDIACLSSRWRFLILRGLISVGFTRIGIYPSHIHVDLSPGRDQEVCWFISRGGHEDETQKDGTEELKEGV